jgi:hypothetical protein
MTAISARRLVNKILSLILLGLGAGASAFAVVSAPEIDPGSGASALTLLAGAILLFRNKISKR